MSAIAGAEPGAIAVAPDRVGRDGMLGLEFERRGGRTVLVRSRFRLPLQVLAPVDLDDAAAVVSVLNPTGGLVGGDRLAIDVAVGATAHACVTTPSAAKVYRSTGPVAEQTVTARLAAGAVLEWVPDHTIPFAGSVFRQRVSVEIGEGARLVLVDAFAAGRVARGERWRFAALESRLAIRDAGGWLLLDRFALGGEGPWAGLGMTEGRPYFATVVLIGDDAGVALTRALEAAVAGCADARVAVATLPRRGVLVRCLARTAPALGDVLLALWSAGRRALLGAPPLALRKA